jgi:hypothetical protein
MNMETALHSDKLCADIVKHVADETKKKIAENIVTNKKQISVLIDESTSLSQKATLVVVLKTFFGEEYHGKA